MNDIIEEQTELHLIDGEVCIRIDSDWYLNEERVYISSLDEAHDLLKQKIEAKKEALSSLREEIYDTKRAIVIIKQHKEKVTESILHNCISCASSKKLTNDPAVLELRMTGDSILNKYIFVLENNDIVALSEREMDLLKLFDNELLEHGKKSAENLKEILEGIY
jgi:hypothetical protein